MAFFDAEIKIVKHSSKYLNTRGTKSVTLLFKTSSQLLILVPYSNPWRRFSFQATVCGADGRSGGRSVYGHVITKFSRMGSLPHFFTHGAPLRASRARAPLLTNVF